MNFFGHAWVAAWFSGNEPFILGAMLPDLANVLRAPPPSSRHAELSAGIRMHHETDRVFPHAYTFDGGSMHPGDAPGLGVDLDEALAATYPYEPAYLPVNRLLDGTVHSW